MLPTINLKISYHKNASITLFFSKSTIIVPYFIRFLNAQSSTPIILGAVMVWIGDLITNLRMVEALILKKHSFPTRWATFQPKSRPIDDKSSLSRSNLLA